MTTKRSRIVGIDVCRSAAIIAAMGSHCLIEAGAFSVHAGGWLTTLRFFFQLSPPLFIGLFGSMLHIAYRPKFARGDVETGITQLLSRSTQCYLLYALCLLVTWMVGDISFPYMIRCIMLLGATPYVDILKFYAIMLLLAPAAIFVASRFKWGLAALFVASLIPHLAFPILSSLPAPSSLVASKYVDLPAGFIYGGAQGVGGPSLIHGFYFVVIGMILGVIAERLLTDDAATQQKARLSLAAIASVSLTLTAAFWNWADPAATAHHIADMSLRNHNHPIYFSLGTAAMVLSAWGALELYDLQKFQFGRRITFVASASLFTFSFGNMILIIAPRMTLAPAEKFAYGGLLLLAVLSLTGIFKWAIKQGKEDQRCGKNSIFAIFSHFQARILKVIQSSVRGPSLFYAKILGLHGNSVNE